ncbi:hypothetical protein [Micromonospora mirobrigensis]|uniref:Helix-hairpin-helix domain n=1 Tax=Micromonospora mirobrigensis TaxID=262898 RepID=A0A1C4WKK2_9ACTN|nr:hypothetical protein [Micromonospora mirobrigensis]SCE96663.1 Helix-hairpin-helix domain [Micromonospora mirobrigensis]
MPSTVGQWLIVILALLVGLAAGWVLNGRRTTADPVRPIVEGDPVAGVTDLDAEPPMPATVDQQRPEVTIDEAPPAAVTADATPVEAETAPAAATLAATATPVPEVEPASATTGAVPAPGTGAVDTAPLADTSPATAASADPETADRVTAGSADLAEAQTAPGDASVPATTTPTDEVTAGRSETDAGPAVLPAQRTEEERVGSALDEEQAGSTADEDAPAAGTSAIAAGTVPAPRTAVHDSDLVTETDLPRETATTDQGDAPLPAVAAEPTATGTDVESTRATPATSGDAVTGTGPLDAATGTAPAAPVTVPPAAEPAADGPADDFRRIQGVGPKMAAALQAAGIRTYGQLAALDEAALRDTIRAAGLRAAPSLATWAQQAKVLAGAPAEAERVLPVGTGADA